MEGSEVVLWSVGPERSAHWQEGPPFSQAGFGWAPSPSLTAMTAPARVPTPAPAGFVPFTQPEPPAWQLLHAVQAPRLLLAPAGLAYSGMACFVQSGQPGMVWQQPAAPASFLGHWQALAGPLQAAACLQPSLTFVPVAETQEGRPAQQQHGSSSSCAGTAGACAAADGSGDPLAASASGGHPCERRPPEAVHAAVDSASAEASLPITVEVRQVDGHAPNPAPAATRAPRPCLEGAAAAAVAARLLEVEGFEPGPDVGAATRHAPAGRRLLAAAEQLPGGMEWEEPVPVDDLFGPDDSWLRETPGTPRELPPPAATPPQHAQRPASGPQHQAALHPALQPAVGQSLALAEAMATLHAVSQHPMMRLLAQPRAAAAEAQPLGGLAGASGGSPQHQDEAEEAAADTEAALHALGCADLLQGGRPATVPPAPRGVMIWPLSMQQPAGPTATLSGWPAALPPSAFAGAALGAEPEAAAWWTGGRRSIRARRMPLRALDSAADDAAVGAGRSVSGRPASLPGPIGDSLSPAAGGRPSPVSRAAARRRGAKRAAPAQDNQAGRAARPRLEASSPGLADGASLAPGGNQRQQGGDAAAAVLGGTAYPWPLFVAPAAGHPHALLPMAATGFLPASAGLPFSVAAHQAGHQTGVAALQDGSLSLHSPPQLLKTSTYRGVSWCKRRQLWEAAISINGKRERLGFYRREQAAARAYDLVAAWRNRDTAAARSSRSATPRRRRRRSSRRKAGEEERSSDGEGSPAPARRVMSQELPLNLPSQLEAVELPESLEALLEDIRAKAKAALSDGGEEAAPQSPSTPPGPGAALPAAASLPASDGGLPPADAAVPADAAAAALQPAALPTPGAAAAAAVVQAIPVAKSSRYQGVCLCRSNRSRWQAQVTFRRRRHYLGMHGSEEEAARAYDQGAICLLGADAQTNFPISQYDVASLAALDIADVAASLKALSRSGIGGPTRKRARCGARAAAAAVPGSSSAIEDSDETEAETEAETETETETESEADSE